MSLIKGADLKGKKLYKFLEISMKHHDMIYKEGENIDVLPFVPVGECSKGGLYFFDESITDELLVKIYLSSFYIADVIIDDDEPVWKESNGKYKTHKITLTNIRNKIKFELNDNVIKLICEGTEKNVEFGTFYKIFYGKEQTKELIKYVMSIKNVGCYLYKFVENIDEDIFFDLIKIKNDCCKEDFIYWIKNTFEKLMKISSNPEELLIRYYENISEKYAIKFDNDTNIFRKYWTKNVISRFLEFSITKNHTLFNIGTATAFILLNYQDTMDMEKLVELRPSLYRFVYNKTIRMTKFILSDKKLSDLYMFIPIELVKEIILKNEQKDEVIFDELIKIKEIKEMVMGMLLVA